MLFINVLLFSFFLSPSLLVSLRSVVATGLVQSLTIQRVQGLKLSSRVSYSTVASTDPITIGEVTFSPAMASVHFTSVSEANVPFPTDVVRYTTRNSHILLHCTFYFSDNLLYFFLSLSHYRVM